MNQLTKITLVWELHEENTPKLHIARKLDVHRETVHLWIKGIEELDFWSFWTATPMPRRVSGQRERLMGYLRLG